MRGRIRMNYEVVPVNSDRFYVLETKTNQIVVECDKLCDARKFMKHFNHGGGFDGNTPNFFLKTTQKVDSIV